MGNDSIRTTVGSVSEEMEPNEHSIDRKTNSANIDNHDVNDMVIKCLKER